MDPKPPDQPPTPSNPGEPESVVTPPFGAPHQTEPHSPFSQSPDQTPSPVPTLVTFTPEITPTPETTTPTAPVFGPARFGNDLGPLMPTARVETPTPEPIPTQPAPPPAPETNPDQRAPDEPFIPTPEPTPPASVPNTEPILPSQPPTEGYHLGDTVVITPEMRTEIDRIKTEAASNQPTEPLPASTPPMTTVEQPPVQVPTPDPMDRYRDMMANISSDSSVPPVGPDELSGTKPFSAFEQPTAQPQTETPAPAKKPWWKFW